MAPNSNYNLRGDAILKLPKVNSTKFMLDNFFFINLTILRSIANKYTLQVSRTLETGKAYIMASDITNFSPRFCIYK